MGTSPAVPMQARFGPGVGTIGRSPDCTLALPDEARHISRQQARVEVGGNGAAITCLSAANPLIINGQELRQGQARRLAHGDRIHVAGYELRFEDVDTAAAAGTSGLLIPDDPFALPEVASTGPPAARPRGASSQPGGGPANRDPLATGAGDPEPRGLPEGFDSLNSLDSLNRMGPLDALDPFADPPPVTPLQAASGSPVSSIDPLGLGLQLQPQAELPARRADSIDALFNLEPGLDPLAPGSPLGQPPGEIRKSAQERGAEQAAQRQADPMADHAPVLSGSFRLPQAIPPTEFGLPEDPVLSWTESEAAQEAVLPPAPAANAAEISALAEQFFKAPRPTPEPPGRAAAPPDRAPAPLPPIEDAPVLLRALLDGLGLAALPQAATARGATAQALTPELLQRIGELIAAACQGTVELLQARATLKQALRADLTMIGSRDNNPLKFVPDGETALAQLLAAQPVRGFMGPSRAMRDAYDDLLAHQVGFVAGMRAAMQGLVARFDPQVLEQRLASKSVLDAMLPAARKARLWELFNSLYAEVSREAEDDFDRLFGRAFVSAYEEQIARIEAGRRAREGGEAGRR